MTVNPIDDPSKVVAHRTRAEFCASWRAAIECGDLIEVEPHRARYVGWTQPIAISAQAWADSVDWQSQDAQRHPAATDDAAERLIRLLQHAKFAALFAPSGSNSEEFGVPRIRRDGPPNQISVADLVVRVDLGGDLQPIITIMLWEEAALHD